MNDETKYFFLSEAHFQNELFYRRAFKLFDKEKAPMAVEILKIVRLLRQSLVIYVWASL